MKTPITIARGDGIGPEIMDSVLSMMEAAGAAIAPEEIQIGESVYRAGHSAGIESASWESIRRTAVFLKAPITTPQGGGVKSLNVTVRKSLGLFANVRPVRSYAPFVQSKHRNIDLVIVRENEEDLYGGIEHRQTAEVTQCLKLISRPGSERIARFAFAYAKHFGRKQVSCFIKDNIMKITDGMFRRVFEEVAAEHPDIASDRRIIDIGTALLADRPEMFDVILTENLYGDILSDVAAQIAGSVGMAGSANLGETVAMFEAVHGSAPDIAGQNVANPSGLLHAAVMMLVHIGQPEVASKLMNAWLCTIEEGVHTADVYDVERSKARVGTREFAVAVSERLGQLPRVLDAVNYHRGEAGPLRTRFPLSPPKKEPKVLVGVDVFVDWSDVDRDPEVLAKRLQKAESEHLPLVIITNRGVKIWPKGMPETFKTDHWRCRFRCTGEALRRDELLRLLAKLDEEGIDVIKTENLYTFGGERGYSLAQGE